MSELGLRLRFLYLWTPNFLIERELRNLSDQTTGALKSLIATYAPQQQTFVEEEQHISTGIKEQRTNMAQTHSRLVEALDSAVGHDKAVALGREALFAVGVALGKQTRIKLGVGENPQDLIRASKILYRILGIDFHIEWQNEASAVAVIERCALAEKYSELTCEVLSATDEGVITGLQPNVKMKFTQYITGGCQNCRANIHFNKEDNTT